MQRNRQNARQGTNTKGPDENQRIDDFRDGAQRFQKALRDLIDRTRRRDIARRRKGQQQR
jgi:hypothetical protein